MDIWPKTLCKKWIQDFSICFRARSTDRNKLTAKKRFCHGDLVTDFVTVILSQSKGLGKMALGIVKHAYNRSSQPIGVVWFVVSLSRTHLYLCKHFVQCFNALFSSKCLHVWYFIFQNLCLSIATLIYHSFIQQLHNFLKEQIWYGNYALLISNYLSRESNKESAITSFSCILWILFATTALLYRCSVSLSTNCNAERAILL